MMTNIVRLAVLYIGLACLGLGCDAFSNDPVEFETLNEMGLLDSGGGGGSAAPSVAASICTPETKVTVKASDTSTVQTNSGWTTAVSAEEAGDASVKITITGSDGSVNFTIQQKGEKEYVACAVEYTPSAGPSSLKHAGETHAATDGETMTIQSGSITIEQFTAKSGDTTVNSGSYSLTFGESGSAAKAVGLLAGLKDATAPKTLQGTYYTKALAAAAE
ncbi:MAG: hypothetical protein HYV03_04425 [Deltaproteobacteria bacterium]|nr:hypothetical protein [Deltaproteobacteria bacterium]